MGIIKPTILLYTHSDYKDVCVPFFGQINKYIPDFKKIIMTDKCFDEIPSDYEVFIYNPNLSYKNRIVSCLSKINEQVVMFIHEDMILFDLPKTDILSDFCHLISNNEADLIKLIKAGEFSTNNVPHKNLVNCPSDNIFSIQPTLCLKSTLEKLFKSFSNDSIYDIEKEASSVCSMLGLNKSFMSSCENENKRGAMHWDSSVFPYIATAIVRGKWNFLEYEKELSYILQEYNIDRDVRGQFLIF